MDEALVTRLCKDLVREYMFQKGFLDVLKKFDEETGERGDEDATSTADLVKQLHVTKLYKANARKGQPLNTVLEVLTHHFLHQKETLAGTQDSSAMQFTDLSAAATSASDDTRPILSSTNAVHFQHDSVVHPPAVPSQSQSTPVHAPPPPEPTGAAKGKGGFWTRLEAAKPEDTQPSAQEATTTAAPPVAPPAPGESTKDGSKSGGFWARLDAANAITAPVPPVPASLPVTAPILADAQPSQEKPAEAATSKPKSGGGFWDRLNATKPPAPAPDAPIEMSNKPEETTLESATPATTATSAPAASATANNSAAIEASENVNLPPSPPSDIDSATQPTAPAVKSDSEPVKKSGGSFWERLQQQQQQQQSAPIPPPAPTPAPAPAPAQSAASTSSFWARLNAGKSDPAPAAPASFAFVAPDGRGFNDRAEYKRYLFDNFYTFKQRSNETLRKKPGDIQGQPFNLSDLNNCTVMLCDHSDMVQVDRVKDCKILIAACCESAFLRNSRATTCSKQLRTRDCVNCRIYLYSKTDPIIERSYGMLFAPFNAAYAGLDTHFKAANLPADRNLWNRLFDFSKDDTTLPSFHWKLMTDEEGARETWIIDDIASGVAINPTAGHDAAAVAPEVDSSLIALDIRSVSQAQAQTLLKSAAPKQVPSIPTQQLQQQQAVEEAAVEAGAEKAPDITPSVNEADIDGVHTSQQSNNNEATDGYEITDSYGAVDTTDSHGIVDTEHREDDIADNRADDVTANASQSDAIEEVIEFDDTLF